jgi:hypothetical protein
LSRKIGRQPSPPTSAAISRPPSSGPAAVANPATAPYQPNARPRSRGGKTDWMIASTGVFNTPAMAPCTTRQATSWAGPVASAQSADAAVNPTSPIRNTSRCPNRSPRRPAGISASP